MSDARASDDHWSTALFSADPVTEATTYLKAHTFITEVSDEIVGKIRQVLEQAGAELTRDLEHGARAGIGLLFADFNGITRRIEELGR